MIFLTWLWLSIAANQQIDHAMPEVLVIDADQSFTRLEPFLRYEIYPIDSNTDLVSPLPWHMLQPLPKTGTSFGYQTEAIQLMFQVHNPSSNPIELVLVTAFPQLDTVIYECRQKGVALWQKELGDKLLLNERNIRTAMLQEMVTFPPGQSEMRIYVHTTSSASVPLYLGSSEAVLAQQTWKQVYNGSFYGIALAVAFFSLIFFIVSKEKIYFLFTGFALSTAAYMTCFDGYAFYFWPTALFWQQRAVFVLLTLSLVFLYAFSKVYLEPWPKQTWVDRMAMILGGFLIASLPLMLILPALNGARLTSINALLTYLFFCVIALGKAIFRREVSAYFYLASFLPLLLLGFATALASLGWFGNFHEMRETGFKVVNVLALMMLSLGLGWRIKLLSMREKEVERQLLIAHTESQTKSEFLAQMSHELRTPMNAIIGMAEVMSGTELDPKQKKYIDIIQTSSDTLLSVINSVLDYSRLEAKRVELSPEPVQLADLITETVKIFKVYHLHLDFKEHIAQNVPAWTEVDPHRLRQILINLLGNAVKFTEAGHISIHCSVTQSKEEGEQLLFEVTDTGIGISKDKQHTLFSPFTQANSTTSRKYGGSGLGLSICKQLVELMGGRIGVTSKLGEGSRFWFKLPCIVSSPKAVAPPAKTKPTNLQKLKVLVVEDNRINIKVIQALLKREGIEPMIAERGYQAIDLVQKHNFDLVFMDCEMPEMDGFETTIAIRKWESEQQREALPIYALTAHALEEHRQRSFAVGMNGHLSKPIQVAELRKVINQIQLTKQALS